MVRLADALNALDARVLNPGSADLKIDANMLPHATFWQFATRHGGIDVVHDAPGASPFDELRKRALQIRLGDVQLSRAATI
jgi:hypothetical protein